MSVVVTFFSPVTWSNPVERDNRGYVRSFDLVWMSRTVGPCKPPTIIVEWLLVFVRKSIKASGFNVKWQRGLNSPDNLVPSVKALYPLLLKLVHDGFEVVIVLLHWLTLSVDLSKLWTVCWRNSRESKLSRDDSVLDGQ